jgi:hypothetical protein
MIKKQKGQSTIEFIFSFMFGLGMVFLFVNVAISYSIGFLVHYATFMASRVYMVHDDNGNGISPQATIASAETTARSVYARYKLSKFGIQDSQLSFNSPFVNTGPAHLYVGAYTEFERPLSIFKFVAGDAKAKLVSESFLGKEVTRGECIQRTCYAITGAEFCEESFDFTVVDDGC